MDEKITSFYTKTVQRLINKNTLKDDFTLLVFLGISDYINIDAFKSQIIDDKTFCLDGGEELFDRIWRKKIVRKIVNSDNGYGILSYQQFCHCEESLGNDFLENVIIIQDNLRSMFQIPVEQYIQPNANDEEADIEERPDKLPIYQAEQFALDGKYYYSVKAPNDTKYKVLPLFQEKKVITVASDGSDDLQTFDVKGDSYVLDIFINDCINRGNFNRKVGIKTYKKHPLTTKFKQRIEYINKLIYRCRGSIIEIPETFEQENFKVKRETTLLLHKYWGKEAKFRDIEIYKNPDEGKELTKVSQGQIVQTIIDEYENSRECRGVRDLLLTAPTGAGKSLLFQLPAFHIAKKGDITIIVSPLMALMKDQVDAIKARGFARVEYINGLLNLMDRDRIIKECQAGMVDILYMAPELLLSYHISHFIGDRSIGLLVIDEAHLITTWGRDFRVDYWYLGGHLKKIRKNMPYSFPIVAVTATAIYGGDNDMVFDTIDSLQMQRPHLYIGKVKRDDISFAINNYNLPTVYYDKFKETQTAGFIEKMVDLGVKTIVYAPYRTHIDKILTRIHGLDKSGKVATYKSDLASYVKEESMEQFRTGQKLIMLCTKAFGMGVDIPDIQVVYHHAPSGLLPDYVQEIGRVARDPNILGIAALEYTEKDQKYSKTLHGLSSIKPYQIQAILKKLYALFLKNGQKRNMVVSTDDFKFIFPKSTADNLSQNVQTGLMMIEKDYLAKVRFNVVIARPKQLFVKVYARTNEYGLSFLKKSYSDSMCILKESNGHYWMLLDLDGIWKKSFVDITFPLLKKKFYDQTLFMDENLLLVPELRFDFELTAELEKGYEILSDIFESTAIFLNFLDASFTERSFDAHLTRCIPNNRKREQYVKFFLTTYSDIGYKETDSFLQTRSTIHGRTYTLRNSNYEKKFSNIKRLYFGMFSKGFKTATRYGQCGSDKALDLSRLGCLLDLFEIGTYECRGGETPMVFIRLNDPEKVKYDSENPNYENLILKKTLNKHKISSELFDYFFMNDFDNSQRWSFIEDFFLGMDNEDLFSLYPATIPCHTEIPQYIEKHMQVFNREHTIKTADKVNKAQSVSFTPIAGTFYADDRQLTIDGVTKTISRWIIDDPVALHKVMTKESLKFSKNSIMVLISKLMNNHKEYYRESLGLDAYIKFTGYDGTVKAKIPYNHEPVRFYNWWRKNEDAVYLSKANQIKLFIKVFEAGGTLLKKHRDMIHK